jgi:membrane protease subunit HflK
MYIEAMQQIMSNTSKVLVDQKSGSNLLYLPLDKLMQMAPPAPEAPKAAEAPAPQEPTTARSREAFRSRDREQR